MAENVKSVSVTGPIIIMIIIMDDVKTPGNWAVQMIRLSLPEVYEQPRQTVWHSQRRLLNDTIDGARCEASSGKGTVTPSYTMVLCVKCVEAASRLSQATNIKWFNRIEKKNFSRFIIVPISYYCLAYPPNIELGSLRHPVLYLLRLFFSQLIRRTKYGVLKNAVQYSVDRSLRIPDQDSS